MHGLKSEVPAAITIYCYYKVITKNKNRWKCLGWMLVTLFLMGSKWKLLPLAFVSGHCVFSGGTFCKYRGSSITYQDLDYCEFAIPGSMKNSIYSSNSSIIGISIIGELFLDLVIPIIEDPLYINVIAAALHPPWPKQSGLIFPKIYKVTLLLEV